MDIIRLPLVSAGFPSPGETWSEQPLDANDLLCLDKDTTRFVQVAGDSMRRADVREYDIRHGDVLVVDQSLWPTHGDMIIARLPTGYVVRQLLFEGNRLLLQAARREFPPIAMGATELGYHFWGNVLFLVRPMHPFAHSRLLPHGRITS